MHLLWRREQRAQRLRTFIAHIEDEKRTLEHHGGTGQNYSAECQNAASALVLALVGVEAALRDVEKARR